MVLPLDRPSCRARREEDARVKLSCVCFPRPQPLRKVTIDDPYVQFVTLAGCLRVRVAITNRLYHIVQV